jgi:hypothetical protein
MRLKQIRRVPGFVAAFSLAALLVAAVAVAADNLIFVDDGDTVTVGPDDPNVMSFGAVACDEETSLTAVLQLRHQGGGQVFKSGSSVTLSGTVGGDDASAVTAGGNTITLPMGWATSTNGTLSDSITSTVKIHPTAEGAGSATITYSATGTGTDNQPLTRTRDTAVQVSWTAGSCNQPPPTPGAPTLDSASTSPNQGVFGLTWAASTDPDGDPVSYRLEHKDNDDAGYAAVTGATALGINAFSFTSAAREAEGTWAYRVQASDGTLQSAYSGDSGAIKVDRSGPSAPTASFDRASEDTAGGWFKDTVTVSYSNSTDGLLADGSAGSGVASNGTSQTFITSATHTYSGTATDNAGNSSAATTGAVKVDATNPSVSISGCPTGPVIAGSSQSVTVSASDAHSDLASDSVQNGATVTLDTSLIGPGSTSVTAKDKVGHTAQATCNYSVAYAFAGFLAPINGQAVNAGKTGRTYPIKWQLKRDDGGGNLVLISDAEALALVGQMSAGQSSVQCGSLIGPSDALEEATTGSTVLRYDSVDDQFIYNYKAPSTVGCYVFGIRKHDGATTKQVQFNFTR